MRKKEHIVIMEGRKPGPYESKDLLGKYSIINYRENPEWTEHRMDSGMKEIQPVLMVPVDGGYVFYAQNRPSPYHKWESAWKRILAVAPSDATELDLSKKLREQALRWAKQNSPSDANVLLLRKKDCNFDDKNCIEKTLEITNEEDFISGRLK